MLKVSFSPIILIFVIISGCSSFKNTVQYEIADGVYKSRIFSDEIEKVYIDNEKEFLYVFLLSEGDLPYGLDTVNRDAIVFPQRRTETKIDKANFYTSEFDIDLVTIPFKYRFPTDGFPQQLNTNLNASVFLGYRTDFYTLKYKENEIGLIERMTNHYGMTFGFFSGFGSTAVNPFVTNDQINIEYDGIVWSNGLSVSFAVDYFNLGLALGWDNLLDNNSSYWIYQKRPWIGLVLGINLN
ncbi:hypothetical protein [Aquiflexum sp.]|uniref:hypothetical protein n=1 Tax=Aquiflexum sp. TaxID=1872584 RepID=UPI0035939153